MRGTTFGTVHSYTHLGLLQQSVSVPPAEPKTYYVDVPGADGSVDLTEVLGVGVKYADRELVWTFALYPGADWYATQAAVSNALNGLACHIVLDDDPSWYYDGRLSVTDHTSDRLLRQITVKAICRPYKRAITETTVSRDDLTTSYKNLTCAFGAMELVPEFTLGQETTLKIGERTVTLSAGVATIPDIKLSGEQVIKAKLPPESTETSGSISIKWRAGTL